MDVLVARHSALQCCEQRIAALLRGQRRALDYLAQQRDDALLRMSRRPGTQPEDVGRALAGMELPDSARNRSLLQASASGQGPTLHDTAQRLADIMRAKDILSHAVPVQTLIDARFAQELAP